MTAIFMAQKNSNVCEYVKARVLNNNLDYILRNGVSELINKLSDPIDVDYIIIWQDGTIEVSIYSAFYEKHDKSTFKKSITKRDDLKGINRNSHFFKENKDIFLLIEKEVYKLTYPFRKTLSKDYFGYINKDSKIIYNVEKYYYFNDTAYVAVKDINLIPESTKPMLEPIKLSDFYFKYEKEIAEKQKCDYK